MLLPRVLARIGGYSMPKWADVREAVARRRRVGSAMLGMVL